MEIRRFGPGHRRPDGPPGTQGVASQVILHDERALISELAFGRFAILTPHANPTSTALFVVISGSGYVQVGDERARVNHGEAVFWPPKELHGAYTDGTEMRAIVIELTGDGPTHLIEGSADEVAVDPAVEADTQPPRPTPAKGALADRAPSREEYDSGEGEPW